MDAKLFNLKSQNQNCIMIVIGRAGDLYTRLMGSMDTEWGDGLYDCLVINADAGMYQGHINVGDHNVLIKLVWRAEIVYHLKT